MRFSFASKNNESPFGNVEASQSVWQPYHHQTDRQTYRQTVQTHTPHGHTDTKIKKHRQSDRTRAIYRPSKDCLDRQTYKTRQTDTQTHTHRQKQTDNALGCYCPLIKELQSVMPWQQMKDHTAALNKFISYEGKTHILHQTTRKRN